MRVVNDKATRALSALLGSAGVRAPRARADAGWPAGFGQRGTVVPEWLPGFGERLRCALDGRTGLVLNVQEGCGTCRCEPSALAAALTEMVRRVRDAMPIDGTLLVSAGACAGPQRDALIPASGTAGHWVAIGVGSDSARSLDLNWNVAPPRTDLARFARRWEAALTLQRIEREGMHLVLHLPRNR